MGFKWWGSSKQWINVGSDVIGEWIFGSVGSLDEVSNGWVLIWSFLREFFYERLWIWIENGIIRMVIVFIVQFSMSSEEFEILSQISSRCHSYMIFRTSILSRVYKQENYLFNNKTIQEIKSMNASFSYFHGSESPSPSCSIKNKY